MNIAKVRGRVITDNTGVDYEMPLLVTDQGPVESLMDYFLVHYHDRSVSWMNVVVQAVRLLLEYLDANHDSFDNPRQLFRGFADKLYMGTIGEDGLDPSGLYWSSRSMKNASRLVGALTGYTDYVAEHRGSEAVNPLGRANTAEQRLNYAAWHRKNAHNFLGHIRNSRLSGAVHSARSFKRPVAVKVDRSCVAFPEEDFERLWKVVSYDRWKKPIELRDRLMLLLLHGGGLRLSELFHLFVQDVEVRETAGGVSAVVRVFHPEEGVAPEDWRGRSGERHRTAYLLQEYGLKPRNRILGSQRAGWKGRITDNPAGFIEVQWMPLEYGSVFLDLWKEYLFHRAQVGKHHPYAFVSFVGDNYGEPLNMSSFYDSYERAVKRAGLIPGKLHGHSPHCHRHAYGRRLALGGISEGLIMKAMHHSSTESQAVYTTPSMVQMAREFAEADARLKSAEHGLAMVQASADPDD